MTKYLIFKQDRETGAWLEELPREATSARAAVREHSRQNGISESVTAPEMFVAVPARSWQPVKVAVETALKFS